MEKSLIHLETDVLVIGGGVAGCLAAMASCEAGLRVIVCDKGQLIERCGSVGGGVDHFLTVMETGPEWDTPEFLIKHLPELTDGIVDREVTDEVIRQLPKMLKKLEGIGVDFRDPITGQYYRHRSFGLPGTYHLNFDGSKFKSFIGRAARVGGSKVLPRTMVTQVLVKDNQAYGAIAFNFRTGEWYAIRAKAVIATTGDVNRLSQNASGLSFDSWHCPYNTGDGQAMGFRVGASLANMEFTESTLTPKGFSTQGLNALCGLGAYFVNRHGERFMFKYDPRAEKARRSVMVDAVINEWLLGNGPLYVDLRHLPQEEIDRIEGTLQIDRHTLPGYYRQKGIKFERDLVEISVSELTIRRSGLYFRGSGLVVDLQGETSVKGLFAAGDCSTVSGGISGAATLGYMAGKGAAGRVRKTGTLPEIDEAELQDINGQLFGAVRRTEGLRYRTYEDEVRKIVTDHVGFRRTESGLKRGIELLQGLRRQEPKLWAPDLHELSRVHEATNIREVAEIMATAALERKESRTGSSHKRLDYPNTDENWRKTMVAEQKQGSVVIRHQSTDEPLSAGFARNSGQET